jgi:hypothetical protein
MGYGRQPIAWPPVRLRDLDLLLVDAGEGIAPHRTNREGEPWALPGWNGAWDVCAVTVNGWRWPSQVGTYTPLPGAWPCETFTSDCWPVAPTGHAAVTSISTAWPALSSSAVPARSTKTVGSTLTTCESWACPVRPRWMSTSAVACAPPGWNGAPEDCTVTVNAWNSSVQVRGTTLVPTPAAATR